MKHDYTITLCECPPEWTLKFKGHNHHVIGMDNKYRLCQGSPCTDKYNSTSLKIVCWHWMFCKWNLHFNIHAQWNLLGNSPAWARWQYPKLPRPILFHYVQTCNQKMMFLVLFLKCCDRVVNALFPPGYFLIHSLFMFLIRSVMVPKLNQLK